MDDEILSIWIDDLEEQLNTCKSDEERLTLVKSEISENNSALSNERLWQKGSVDMDAPMEDRISGYYAEEIHGENIERLSEYGSYLTEKKQELEELIRDKNDDWER